jgi:hypothetical protein
MDIINNIKWKEYTMKKIMTKIMILVLSCGFIPQVVNAAAPAVPVVAPAAPAVPPAPVAAPAAPIVAPAVTQHATATTAPVAANDDVKKAAQGLVNEIDNLDREAQGMGTRQRRRLSTK